jgi:hypothetical protein
MATQGGFAVESGLRQVFIVEHGVTRQRLLEVFAAVEMMGLQDVRDASIESLDHSIGLWRPWSGQPVLDVQRGAWLVKFIVKLTPV